MKLRVRCGETGVPTGELSGAGWPPHRLLIGHHFHDVSLAFETREVTLGETSTPGRVDRWLLSAEHKVSFDRRSARAGLGPIGLGLSLQAKTADDYFGGDFCFDQYKLGITLPSPAR